MPRGSLAQHEPPHARLMLLNEEFDMLKRMMTWIMGRRRFLLLPDFRSDGTTLAGVIVCSINSTVRKLARQTNNENHTRIVTPQCRFNFIKLCETITKI